MLYERRDIKRRHLIYHLDVCVAGSAAIAGHLADLSAEGLLVITDEPLPTDHMLTLRLRMPPDWDGESEVELKASCRWTRRDVNPDYHANGLELIDPAPQYLETMQSLLRAYGFND